jgi:predicted HNH restriction endonuclease
MKMIGPNRSNKIVQSLEKDISKNIGELTRTSAVFHNPENGKDEMSANNLGTLLRRVTELSMREIEGLIDELHELRKKLETDGNRIQSYFARYEELNQGVRQLTTIISDNVKGLPSDTPATADS